MDDILSSDFLVFDPVRDASVKNAVLAQSRLQEIGQEDLLFRSWLTDLSEKDGVRLISETQNMRVVALEDCMKFRASFSDLLARHSWSPSFQEVNPAHSLWGRQELDEQLMLSSPVITNVHFGDSFVLHAFSYTRAENKLTVRIWWQPMQQNLGREWVFFVYALDDHGKEISNTGVPLGCLEPEQENHPIRLSIGKIDDAPYKHITQLAVGFFHPPGTALNADKGARDWGNNRLLIPLNRTGQKLSSQ